MDPRDASASKNSHWKFWGTERFPPKITFFAILRVPTVKKCNLPLLISLFSFWFSSFFFGIAAVLVKASLIENRQTIDLKNM